MDEGEEEEEVDPPPSKLLFLLAGRDSPIFLSSQMSLPGKDRISLQ